MKKPKKLLAMLIASLFLVSAFGLMAFAADAGEAAGCCVIVEVNENADYIPIVPLDPGTDWCLPPNDPPMGNRCFCVNCQCSSFGMWCGC